MDRLMDALMLGLFVAFLVVISKGFVRQAQEKQEAKKKQGKK